MTDSLGSNIFLEETITVCIDKTFTGNILTFEPIQITLPNNYKIVSITPISTNWCIKTWCVNENNNLSLGIENVSAYNITSSISVMVLCKLDK